MRNAVLAIILPLLVFLSCNRSENLEKEDRPTVATLKNIEGLIKWREANKLVWQPSSPPQPLSNYDGVWTEQASKGGVTFVDGTELIIEENTMVIILEQSLREKISHSELALSSGELKGALPPASSQRVELRIRTRSGWITASNQIKGKPSPSSSPKFTAKMTAEGELRVKNESSIIHFVSKEVSQELPAGAEIVIEKTKVNSNPNTKDNDNGKAFAELPSVTREEIRFIQNTEGDPAKPERKIAAKTQINVFQLSFPKKAKTETKESTLLLRGTLLGELEVFLNGEPLTAGKDGTFTRKVDLNPGANMFTFQIVDPKKGQVRYETREIFLKK